MKREDVLVLDSTGPNALALCRSLGRHGLTVTAGGDAPYLPAMLSRYSERSYVHPSPVSDRRGFVSHLREHLERNEYAAVFPVTDLTTCVLSRHKDDIERTGTAVAAEDWETWLSANDAKRLFEVMADVDVPTPETHAPETESDVERIDDARSDTVVVKPRRTTSWDGDGGCTENRISGRNYVRPGEDLLERYRDIIEGDPALQAEFPVVQEYVDGVGTMATVGLAEDGELLRSFQHEKFRVYPPSGGTGAVRKGIREPRMKTYAERVIDALGWTGPIHVEFMKTADDDFYLLEVNGRYWGSLALTIHSGVDIPWHHYQQLNGGSVYPEPASRYRTDVKQRKLFYKDLLWLAEQLSRRRIDALVPFVGSFFTTRDEFLDLDDPLPFFGLVSRSLRILANRRQGRSQF